MTDPTPPATPPTPDQPDAATASAADAKPPKRPGIIRKSAVILLLVLVVLVVLAFPLVIEPWLIGKVKSSLADQKLKLNDDAKLDLSIFGGRLHGENIKLTDATDGHLVLSAATLDGDVAVLDSAASFDLIIDSLVARDAQGDLRRRGDGSIPILTPPGAEGDGSKTDWWSYYQKVSDYLKKKRDEQQKQEEEQKKHPEQKPAPEAKQPPDSAQWPQAKRYEPPPSPAHRGPRVLVRKLEITGTQLGLPDSTPFDVTKFAVEGKDVCLTQEPGETMNLTAKVETKGAGPIDLAIDRLPGDDGTMKLTAPQLPIEALADPHVSGDALAKYGASGLANIDLSTNWKDWDLLGDLKSVVKDLKLSPQAGAGGEAQSIARVVNNLKGQAISWPMKLGGTLYAPKVTDTGADAMKGSAMDAAKGAAQQKATEEATKAVDKQLEKNPQAKQAAEQLKEKTKGLNLPGFGGGK